MPPNQSMNSANDIPRRPRRRVWPSHFCVGATATLAARLAASSSFSSATAFSVPPSDTAWPPCIPMAPVQSCRPPSSSTALQITKQQLGEFEVLGVKQQASGSGRYRTVQILDYCTSSSDGSGATSIDPIGFNDMWDVQKVLVQGQLDRTMEVMKLSKAKASKVGDEEEIVTNNIAERHCQFLPQPSNPMHVQDDNDVALGKDTIILLQHRPVYTLGTGSDPDFIKESGLSSSIDVVRIERGGEVTYHGPGQLVAYPILDLRGYKQDIHWYMRALEEAILLALESVGVEGAVREDDVTGIWIGGKKVAALGVKVRRWITMHGLAVNVNQNSLGNFDGIVPCGLVGKDVTCINDHLEEPISVEEFAKHMRKALEQIFEIDLVDCSLVEAVANVDDGGGGVKLVEIAKR